MPESSVSTASDVGSAFHEAMPSGNVAEDGPCESDAQPGGSDADQLQSEGVTNSLAHLADSPMAATQRLASGCCHVCQQQILQVNLPTARPLCTLLPPALMAGLDVMR